MEATYTHRQSKKKHIHSNDLRFVFHLILDPKLRARRKKKENLSEHEQKLMRSSLIAIAS